MYCRTHGYQLLRCRHCGFVRVAMPEGFDYASLYGRDYFFGRGFDRSALIPEAREPDRALLARRNYWLRVLAASVGGPGRLLDVGCGAGALLNVARDLGWNCEGQEISPIGAAEAISRGHRIQVGELIDCKYPANSFDVVTMIEVVEHIRDPRPTTEAALTLLRPGGWLFITTGDIGSVGARMQGCRWNYIRPPGHVSYFGRRSLSLALAASGFDEITMVPTYDEVFATLPVLGPRRSWLASAVARWLRRASRMEQYVMARAPF
jgi:SAM-dependent methyltransferase